MEYNYSNDKIEERGFISKSKILEYISEEEIFKLIFGFKPIEYDYVKSPFRVDDNSGCWFEYVNGKLLFNDLGNLSKVGKIRMNYIDCFDAVQVYYNINSFYQTLRFIKRHLIDGKNLPKRELNKVTLESTKKKGVEIFIRVRRLNLKDKAFWSKYLITSQNLIDDKVFPITHVKLLNTKKGNVSFTTSDISYVYTDFLFRRKKIYRPNQKGKKRFITNCKADDIGNIQQLKPYGRQLIITKSYKDCRVLRNIGLNSVWFQNEGMRPSIKSIIELCKRFEEVIIFYDNDIAGVLASSKISREVNIMIPNKSRSLYLPIHLSNNGITDPSDFIVEYGEYNLRQFLIQNNIVI